MSCRAGHNTTFFSVVLWLVLSDPRLVGATRGHHLETIG